VSSDTTATDPLLEPFTLGDLQLRNRIFSSSHAPGYNTDGTPSERYVAYHEEKAKGGIGLTMIGGSSNVSPDSASGRNRSSTPTFVASLPTSAQQPSEHEREVSTASSSARQAT